MIARYVAQRWGDIMYDARMRIILEYIGTLRKVYLNKREDTDNDNSIDNSFVDGANDALNRIMSFCNVVDDLIIEVINK